MNILEKNEAEAHNIWEAKYSSGLFQKYPWDTVVSFVVNNAPRDRPRSQVEIMEVGFGSGPNLWFGAREGFKVSGIEASASAVEFTERRFQSEGINGDLRLGTFTELPFGNDAFDLIIDRAALACVGKDGHDKSIAEVYRCLRKGGRFLHIAYGDSHSSMRNGEMSSNGQISNISSGALLGIGPIYFTSRTEIDKRFSHGWRLLNVQRRECIDMLQACSEVHTEWVVIAEKV